MKLFKKVLSVAAVLAFVITAIPAKALAASDAVDFENGDFTGFTAVQPTETTDTDADKSVLSVVDYNGSKALFVDVQDSTKTPKVRIDAVALVGASNLDKVRAITMDVTCVNPDGEVAGWNGGGSGAGTGLDGSTWYQEPNQWTAEEYEKSEVTFTWTMKFVDGLGFTKDATSSFFMFMKWSGSTNDMYIDNVKFLDADGNPIALQTAAVEATDTAAATDDSAATADVPKTGTTSYALFFLAGAAAMAAGAVVIRRRKSVEE